MPTLPKCVSARYVETRCGLPSIGGGACCLQVGWEVGPRRVWVGCIPGEEAALWLASTAVGGLSGPAPTPPPSQGQAAEFLHSPARCSIFLPEPGPTQLEADQGTLAKSYLILCTQGGIDGIHCLQLGCSNISDNWASLAANGLVHANQMGKTEPQNTHRNPGNFWLQIVNGVPMSPKAPGPSPMDVRGNYRSEARPADHHSPTRRKRRRSSHPARQQKAPVRRRCSNERGSAAPPAKKRQVKSTVPAQKSAENYAYGYSVQKAESIPSPARLIPSGFPREKRNRMGLSPSHILTPAQNGRVAAGQGQGTWGNQHNARGRWRIERFGCRHLQNGGQPACLFRRFRLPSEGSPCRLYLLTLLVNVL